MSDYWIHLDQLTPDQALRLLDETVTDGGADWIATMEIEATRSAFGHTAALVVPATPDPAVAADSEAARARMDALIDRYRSQTRGEPRRMVAREGGMPLTQGLVWLVLEAEPDPHGLEEMLEEHLFVVRDQRAEQAAALFEELRFHATQTRVAATTDDDGPVYVFHIRDDRERLSSLESLSAADLLPAHRLLAGRRVDGLTLFLPEECRAGPLALSRFCRILRAAPALLGLSGDLPGEGLFVAVDPHGRGRDLGDTLEHLYDLLYLGRLSFTGQADLSPAPMAAADVGVHDLVDSARALDDLRVALARVEPAVGYSLELRRVRFREPAEIERARLLERQAEIDYRLAYLDSITAPRPRLLRFSHRRLPALAEVVRAFPMKALREGYPLYGYQVETPFGAGEDRREGYHYLLIHPEDTVSDDMDPLIRWEHLDQSAMTFQLDPFWARYYHDQGNECLVFVPEGAALFPTMHGWDTAGMDAYMREAVHGWMGANAPEIPAKPIYIFDGEIEPNAPLRLTILDREALAPLQARLGWINDHLAIAGAIGIEAYVTEMADDAARSELAERLHTDAREAGEGLEVLIRDTNQTIADRLEELTSVVTEEMNSLVAETHRTTVRLEEYHDYLKELLVLRNESRQTATRAEQLIEATEDGRQELSEYLTRLQKQVEKEVSGAYKTRRAMIGRITRTIRELGATHEELKQQLSDALRFKR